jgi:hypothetical protein
VPYYWLLAAIHARARTGVPPKGLIIARLKRIGFEVGKSFDIDKVDPAVKQALETVPEDAQKLMCGRPDPRLRGEFC